MSTEKAPAVKDEVNYLLWVHIKYYLLPSLMFILAPFGLYNLWYHLDLYTDHVLLAFLVFLLLLISLLALWAMLGFIFHAIKDQVMLIILMANIRSGNEPHLFTYRNLDEWGLKGDKWTLFMGVLSRLHEKREGQSGNEQVISLGGETDHR